MKPQGGGTVVETEFLPRIRDEWVMRLAWAAAICLGLVSWYNRASNPIYKWFHEGQFRTRDIEHLFFNGMVWAAVPLVLVYGMAWLAARTGVVDSRRRAQLSLGRAVIPGLLVAPLLLVGAFFELRSEVLMLAWVSPFALILGLLAWRFLAYDPPLPEKKRLRKIRDRVLGLHPAVQYAIPIGFLLLYIAWFVRLSVLRHLSFGTCMLDFSIYDQLMWNALNGRWFECAMFNFEMFNYRLADYNNNFFAEHFIPTLFVIFPIFWLFPSSLTLLVTEVFFLSLAAIPVYIIARKKLNAPVMGLVFAAAWLLHPMIQQKILKDFHVDGLAPLFLLSAFAAYLHGRNVLYFVLLLLTLGCKEELTVAVAGLGLFLFFGEKDRKIGGATFALGIVYFIAVVGFVMPWYRGGDPVRQLGYFRYLIPDAEPDLEVTKGLLLKSMIMNPLHTIDALFTQSRLRGILFLMGPYALFMLWSRWAWLFVLPSLGVSMMSNLHIQNMMEFQYGITIIPAVTVASIYGMAAIMRRGIEPETPLPAHATAGGTVALAAACLLFWGEYSMFPAGGRYDRVAFTVLPHNELAHRYLDAVPGDARVSTQLHLGPHMTWRRYVYMFPEILDAEYVMLDTRAPGWPLNVERFEETVRDMLQSGEWGVYIPYEDGFLLLKKDHPTDLNEHALENLIFERYRPERYGE